MSQHIYRLTKLIYFLFFSLLVGFMAVVQWTLVPAQNRLDATGYATLEQGMNRVLTTLTPVLMIGSIATGLVVVWLARKLGVRTWPLYLVAVAAAAAMVISTLLINAPINTAIDTWNAAAPPANWMALRDRWELGHTIRSYVGLAGLVVALAAACWDGTLGAEAALRSPDADRGTVGRR